MQNTGILILDKEPILKNIFYDTFKEKYQIYLVNGISEATKTLRSIEVDIVIVDYETISNTGLEFIVQVKKEIKNIVCILLVNEPTNKLLNECISHDEVFCFHTKPLNLFDLQYSIEKAKKFINIQKENQKLIEQLNCAKIKTKQAEILKNSILSNISHEIRTPLNSIMGFTSLISSHNYEKERISLFKKIILDSSNQLLNIIEDLLTIAKIDAGFVNVEKKVFDLSNFFNAIFKLYRQKAKENDIFLELKGINNNFNCLIETDKTKLFEIFRQLLDNAFKFTKTGFISFGIYNLEKCIFFIKDSGIGIGENKLYEIFNQFQQESSELNSRKFGGNGLGLSIVKAYLEAVNGQIWLKSKKHEGTTLYFKIPFEIIKNQQVKETNVKSLH